MDELLLHLDANLCRELLFTVLPDLKLLDPACGSGAFLVAAMKTLINLYSAVIGRIKALAEPGLSAQLRSWEAGHKSLAYFIKRTIITHNLFGVDIMEEATEIAKLRLFLALVASARTVEELEPLPNVDFNIIAGNSLVGLLRVDAHEFATKASGGGGDWFRKSYRQVVEEKNRSIRVYRDTVAWAGGVDLSAIKLHIEQQRQQAQGTLNELLMAQMQECGVKFEAATWDAAKGKAGKPVKRALAVADIQALQPLHWGFEFDEILHERGGFDAIITNPPWEILKPQAKEFFAEHSMLVTKNKMTIKEFEQEQDKLLADAEIRAAWLEYQSRFPHVSAWFRASPQFRHQSAVVNGKKTGSDVNLYKLFLEQCTNLLRDGGECGIVIPSGIYTDLGAKGLRDLLFNHNQVTGLFGFENRKAIFEGVASTFKFVVLTFEKGGHTEQFPTAFMRREVSELADFPGERSLPLSVELIRRLSPDSHSVMEFKSALDIHIVEKMLKFPLLGEKINEVWNLRLTREFDMTNDSHLFKTQPGVGRLPLYEGKMIHQFQADYAQPRYWVDRTEAEAVLRATRARNLKQNLKRLNSDDAMFDKLILNDTIPLDHHSYRFGFRDITASTNERGMICSILPTEVFAGNTLNLLQPYEFEIKTNGWSYQPALKYAEQLFVVACLNSFTVDWLLRQKITSHLNMFYVYQAPIPRLTAQDPKFAPIVTRAARLICTSPEFDALAQAVGLDPTTATPPPNPLPLTGEGGEELPSCQGGIEGGKIRDQLRAELDGLIAHLYGLDDHEFAHILTTFPLVPEPTKTAALAAYRALA